MYTASGRLSDEALIEDYLPAVRRQALSLKVRLPESIELDDLIQAGFVGLLDALSRYDHSTGVAFGAFANQRIRGAMIDELRSRDWLPRSVRRNARVMEEAIRNLEQRFRRPPEEREIAAEMGMKLEDYRQLLSDTNNGYILGLEELEEESGDLPATDSAESSPIDNILEGENRALVAAAIDSLPEREKQLLALYYQEELNLKEIGLVFGVSESRVCQLHSQAIKRLRVKLRQVTD